jgi:hypothetical protein
MKRHLSIVGGLIATLVPVGTALVVANSGSDAKAAEVMKAARQALGGEEKLSGLKGLSLRAEFRRDLSGPFSGGGGARTFVIMGGGGGDSGGQLMGSIAIDVLFPDKFYREETGSGPLAMTRVDGFDGDRPFLDVSSNSPGMRVMADRPADDPARAKAALKRGNTDLARLLLGLVAGSHAGMPVTYAYAGEAESAETVADVIDVTGPDDFKARLFIDSTSHLPLMLTFVEPESRPVRMMTRSHDGAPPSNAGGAPPGTRTVTRSGSGPDKPSDPAQLTPEQRAEMDKLIAEAEATPPKLVEHRMFFADHREVGGILLPHRLSRATAGKTTEEWEIKDYKVNPNIKADRFKVGSE